MDPSLRQLLEEVANGETNVDQALERLAARRHGTEALPYARVDHDRRRRCGFPEVIFAAGKTPAQVAGIFAELCRSDGPALATRASAEQFEAVRREVPGAHFDELARCVWWRPREPAERPGKVVVVAAGTADLPVAREALLTADLMDANAELIADVGVAGLHRLLRVEDRLRSASALVVVAGMEGALPSVVGGLVSCPVIACPTSVGYGASFQGLAALLAMLNSCAAGISVVNIDNGFGAGYAAGIINRRIHSCSSDSSA
jgi:hypothetical protein